MEIQNIINELKKVVYGKDEILRKIILCQLSSGHVLLEDVPGVGKTTIALAFSKIMDLDYQRMQFTSDVMPSD
ncbi:MAG: AAA family ATPase, partial [Erysipelotrichaceae bacterium]